MTHAQLEICRDFIDRCFSKASLDPKDHPLFIEQTTRSLAHSVYRDNNLEDYKLIMNKINRYIDDSS